MYIFRYQQTKKKRERDFFFSFSFACPLFFILKKIPKTKPIYIYCVKLINLTEHEQTKTKIKNNDDTVVILIIKYTYFPTFCCCCCEGIVFFWYEEASFCLALMVNHHHHHLYHLYWYDIECSAMDMWKGKMMSLIMMIINMDMLLVVVF